MTKETPKFMKSLVTKLSDEFQTMTEKAVEGIKNPPSETDVEAWWRHWESLCQDTISGAHNPTMAEIKDHLTKGLGLHRVSASDAEKWFESTLKEIVDKAESIRSKSPQRVLESAWVRGTAAALSTLGALGVVVGVIVHGGNDGSATPPIHVQTENVARQVIAARIKLYNDLQGTIPVVDFDELRQIDPAIQFPQAAKAAPVAARPSVPAARPMIATAPVHTSHTMTCPTCGGVGGKYVTLQGIWSTQSEWITCPQCGGCGYIVVR